MCGIAGGWFPRGAPKEAVRDALSRITHRGPDDEGVHFDGPVALGMRRLSIIDVEGGHQPIHNEDDSVHVVQNGEIYNYRELGAELRTAGHELRTQSDTEVLVHLYEDVGTGLFDRLRGMFAVALFDEEKRTLILGRDRFGKKPLFYSQTPNGGLVFASELKALLPLLGAEGQSPSIRDQAIYDYLSFGVVPQPDTIYAGVHCVPPGSFLQFSEGTLERRRYWSLRPRAPRPLSFGEALEETRNRVSQAVRLRLRSDVPLGVFLSGGVDSSVVAYEASRHVGGDLRTFTIGTGDRELDESPVAARTAKALGVKNDVLELSLSPRDDLEWIVNHYDQPFSDSSAIPSLAVSRLAREHVTVVLNGDGGDELFAGYRRYLAAAAPVDWVPEGVGRRLSQAAESAARTLGRRSVAGFGARFVRGLGQGRGSRYLTWTTDMLVENDKRSIWKRGPARPTEAWVEDRVPGALSGLEWQLEADARINLLSDLLVKMDMATMAASLEARSPLLDHELAELVAEQSPRMLLRGGRPKALLREAYRGLLPEEVVQGKKRGFEIPLRRWLAEDWRELMADTVASPSAEILRYLDAPFVSGVVEGRLLTDRNLPYVQYALLVLELWLRGQRA